MTPLTIYAIVLACCVSGTLCANAVRILRPQQPFQRLCTVRAALSTRILQDNRWPSCTWLTLILQLCVITIDLSLTFINVNGFGSAASTAGTLAALNLAFFYFGPHHSFIADLFGISIQDTRQVHYFMLVPLLILIAIHISGSNGLANVFSLPFHMELYGVMTCLAMALMLLFSIRPFRVRFYEIFLRSHQLLGAVVLYTLWAHVQNTNNLTARYAVLSIMVMFGCVSLAQIVVLLCTHRFFLRGFPRIYITGNNNILHLHLELATTLRIHAGQYINLCIPGLSISSILQSHPFMVLSAKHGRGKTFLQLVVVSKRGWTSKLQWHRDKVYRDISGSPSKDHHSFRCIFSGPHGPRRAVDDFGVVILVASGWGVFGVLPYVEYLLQGSKTRTVKARRIHLLWQLRNSMDGKPVSKLLDDALDEDAVEGGYIMKVSIYHLDGDTPVDPGRRVKFQKGRADWKDLLTRELSPTTQNSRNDTDLLEPAFCHEEFRTLILVCAGQYIREEVLSLRRTPISSMAKFVESDFQPDE